MKLEIQINSGSQTSDHKIELSVATGKGQNRTEAGKPQWLRFSSDGVTLVADSEEISSGVYSILIDGRSYEAQISKRPGNVKGDLGTFEVVVGLRHYWVRIRDPRSWRRRDSGVHDQGPQDIVAPMPGKIIKVLVSENQEVLRNQELLVMEAMKMQNVIRAPRVGRVERIYTLEGSGVEAGFRLLRLV